jgi:hypothetical protein
MTLGWCAEPLLGDQIRTGTALGCGRIRGGIPGFRRWRCDVEQLAGDREVGLYAAGWRIRWTPLGSKRGSGTGGSISLALHHF